ncbi:MAG: fimbria/pilus outer membrane usher protein [Leucothrix sp.]
MQNRKAIGYLRYPLLLSLSALLGVVSAADLTVPVMQSGSFVGEANVRVEADGSGLMANAANLASLFNSELTVDAVRQFEALPAGKFLTVEEAEALGLIIRFDMASTVIQASIAGSAKSKTELSLAGSRRTKSPTAARSPSGISGFLNMFAVSSASNLNGNYEFSDLAYSFDTAIHIAPLAHMTLEAFGSINANGDFYRGDIRSVWRSNNPDNRWQLRVGDVGTPSISYMRGLSIQGLEFTNTDSRRLSRAGVASVGNREFFLERRAVARLLIDGREVRRFNLNPGPYNVKDFPLTNGANDIAFIIEDERGEVDRIEFNVFSDTSLVAPGEYRYGFSLGHGLSNVGRYQYDSSKALLSGFIETGITPAFSLGGGLQLTENAQLGVVTARLATQAGRFDFEAGAILDNNGPNGEAAKLMWRNHKTKTDREGKRYPPSLALSAAYKSEHFRDVFSTNQFNEEKWRFDASYSQQLRNGFSVGLGSNFINNRTISDSFKHTLSLGKSINRWILGGDVTYLDNGNNAGWEAGLTVGYDFGRFARVRGRYDYDLNGNERTSLDIASDYAKGIRFGNGLLDYNIGLSANEDGDGSINGGLGYRANRFEFSASHSTDIKSLTNGNSNGQRTTLRAGAAVAFAEGKFAIGRPIRDSFAIFYPHSTIAGSQLLIGNRNEQGLYDAQSDGLGPLLVDTGGLSSFSSYNRALDLRYDVNNLPLGYDLGTGLASISPRYKSGFAVQVGSAYNVIATGTLLDAYDRPLKLLLGKATEMGVKSPRSSDAFTDNEGRLSASGLSAGRWKVEMFAKKPVTYILNIPQGKTGIVELGQFKPARVQ